MTASNPEFEKTVKRNKQGEFSDKDKNVQPTTGMSVNMPYEEPETPTIHRLASDLFNYGKGVKETRVVSCICPDDTIRIDFEDGRIIMGGFDPDYPSCFTFSTYMSQEELNETMEACTDTYDFENETGETGFIEYVCGGSSTSAPEQSTEPLESLSGEKLKQLAENPDTSPDILRLAAQNHDRFCRENAARNPNTPADMLDQLATDENTSVRSAVACNTNTPRRTLGKLSFDDKHYVRANVACNASTPPSALEWLAEDDDVFVRVEIANNPNTPTGTLDQLAGDKTPMVRAQVADNPNTPLETVERLTQDEREGVRVVAQQKLQAHTRP